MTAATRAKAPPLTVFLKPAFRVVVLVAVRSVAVAAPLELVPVETKPVMVWVRGRVEVPLEPVLTVLVVTVKVVEGRTEVADTEETDSAEPAGVGPEMVTVATWVLKSQSCGVRERCGKRKDKQKV